VVLVSGIAVVDLIASGLERPARPGELAFCSVRTSIGGHACNVSADLVRLGDLGEPMPLAAASDDGPADGPADPGSAAVASAAERSGPNALPPVGPGSAADLTARVAAGGAGLGGILLATAAAVGVRRRRARHVLDGQIAARLESFGAEGVSRPGAARATRASALATERGTPGGPERGRA